MKQNQPVLASHMGKLRLCAALLLGSSCTCHTLPQQDKLVVFAAASLREAWVAMAKQFGRMHPEAEVAFNFAGTQELRAQIEHGAAADILAFADERQMEVLLRKGLVQPPLVFAHNKLVVVVAKNALPQLRNFADLPLASRIVVGVPEVPVGQYTLRILQRANAVMPEFGARVEAKVVSREFDSRQVLAKVRLGAAQAGFVYATDALSAPKLGVVHIPDEFNPVASYFMAVSSKPSNPRLARQWVEFVLSEAGQNILKSAGFMPLTPGH